jgi:hypothetical protein
MAERRRIHAKVEQWRLPPQFRSNAPNAAGQANAPEGAESQTSSRDAPSPPDHRQMRQGKTNPVSGDERSN